MGATASQEYRVEFLRTVASSCELGNTGHAAAPSRSLADGFSRLMGVLTRLVESGRRESNPHDQLGRLELCH
jgi:hypothetical protein